MSGIFFHSTRNPKKPNRTELADFITSIVLQNIKKLKWRTIGDIGSFEKEVLVPNKIEMNGFKQILIKFRDLEKSKGARCGLEKHFPLTENKERV